MKKPVCEKGPKCTAWRKDLFHTAIFVHSSEDETGTTVTESPERKSTKKAGRPKKRDMTTAKEGPPAKKSAVETPVVKELHDFLEQKYMVAFPAEFLNFWNEIASFHDKKKIVCDFFKDFKNLRLVGPFEVLFEKACGNEVEHDEDYYFTAHRFATDLPEMQTLAVYDGGRYAYWRDSPKSKEIFIVNVQHDSVNFPKAEIIGDADPRWILVHLLGNKPLHGLSSVDRTLWGSFYKTYQKDISKFTRERKKNSYGEAFHGLGIYVEVKGDVGYRPLENPPPAKLKRYIKDYAACEEEAKKEKLRDEIMNCTTFVDIANDEMDYSLGLEVGHDLFWSNYAVVDRLAEITLSNSYSLLERNEFKTILKAHMKVRRSDPALSH